jgi:acyl dehydratase
VASDDDIISEELRSWIGRSTGRLAVPDPVSDSEIRRYSRATGDENPLWFDDNFARSAGYRGRLVPPMVVHEVFRRAGGQGGDWAEPWFQLPLPSGYTDARNAGTEVEWLRPVYLGERLFVEGKIAGIVARRGRSGVGIYITRDEEVTSEANEVVFRRRQTVVRLRPAIKGSAS